ncbi:MAG: phosphomannomutase, partial [Holosporales bacterium]
VENLLKKTPPCQRPLKVIWDPGNGAFGIILKEVTDRLPHASLILHEEVDGTFPNRSPDPTKPSALKKLTDAVLREQADVGFAFDGDGDRVVVVDHRGIPFAGDELLFVFASRLLPQIPQLKVVADIKCSPFLLRELEGKGAQVFVEKTGHVHIKKRMTTEGALLGGEVSGHFFFKDAHPGFDDGLYGALRILEFFAENYQFLKEVRREIPQRHTSPEIRLSCQENEKNLIISKIKEDLLSKKASFRSLDGIQVIREKEWWLIRASQTEASLIVRFEAFDESSFHSLAKEIAFYLAPWGVSL